MSFTSVMRKIPGQVVMNHLKCLKKTKKWGPANTGLSARAFTGLRGSCAGWGTAVGLRQGRKGAEVTGVTSWRGRQWSPKQRFSRGVQAGRAASEHARPVRAARTHLAGMVVRLFILKARGWGRDLLKIESRQ